MSNIFGEWDDTLPGPWDNPPAPPNENPGPAQALEAAKDLPPAFRPIPLDPDARA